MASFRYTHAIVCRVPNSFKSQAIGITNEINLEEARKQHEDYCRALRQVGLDVIELPADENLPDCVFVEDTAVVCNGTVLITRPGHPARRKEVETMRAIFKKELEMPVIEIKDESATLEGGDVLFTGREFFVGISCRTNEAGAKAVAMAFPEYPVTPIKVSTGLHLKSSMSMAGPDIICVGASKGAQEVLRRIEREATHKYQTLTVPDDDAANGIYVNGTLIHRADFPESLKIIETKIDFPRLKIDIPQFTPVHGNLSCLSILIFENNIKTPRRPVDFTDVGKPQAHLTCASIIFRKPVKEII